MKTKERSPEITESGKPAQETTKQEAAVSTLEKVKKSDSGAKIVSKENGFSVVQSLNGKNIFIIGGTGFLGRIMLYMLLRYVPNIGQIYLLVRPTHGQSAEDRMSREVLNNPVFTTNPGDSEMIRHAAEKKVTVIQGDASRPGFGVDPEKLKEIGSKIDAVLNTAGNVEFNPPLDLSLGANALTTKEALAFAELTKGKRYVHISTCYVADRSLHLHYSPEAPVSSVIKTKSGGEISIEVEREIEAIKKRIDELRAYFETPDKMREFKQRARKEIEKNGKHELSDRLVDKIAKNIKTFELREALITEGRERAERVNRPNVYTYTKTLAELLVQSKSHIQSAIVRPSIVEGSNKVPFEGWNEGVQGSAPLMYLMHRGHRMIPSLSDNPEERRDAVLDLIPVDEVAAGTILALAALVKGVHKPVYQLAAGPIDYPVFVTRALTIFQTMLRDVVKEESKGFVRWFKLNIQANTVSKTTFEKYSSPRMFKFLSKVKERADSIKSSKLPPMGQKFVKRVQENVDRFYNISYLKNRIFGEFMPFVNHGYPTFINQNAKDLWKQLPAEEKDEFHFNPDDIDFTKYLSEIHAPGVVKWIFPVLDKRFASLFNPKTDKKVDDRPLLAGLLSDLQNDPYAVVERFRKNVGNVIREMRQDQRDEAEHEHDPYAYIEKLVEKSGGLGNAAELTQTLRIVTGHDIDGEKVAEFKTVQRVKSYIEKLDKAVVRVEPTGLLKLNLPKDGVEVPGWAADPTRGFLYQIQMWFYRSVLKTEIVGSGNVPWHTNNVVVIANHSSHLDYGLVQYSLGEYGRNMGILAAKDYFFNKFWKSTFFHNFMTLIPIDRDAVGYAQAFEPAFNFLGSGNPILIFPEGTRSPDGQLRDFKLGLGYLVQKARADVLPIRIEGSYEALPKGRTIPRGRNIKVEIGNVISYDELEQMTESMSPTRAYDTITKEIQKRFRDLG